MRIYSPMLLQRNHNTLEYQTDFAENRFVYEIAYGRMDERVENALVQGKTNRVS